MSSKLRFHYPLEPVLLTRQWDLDALLLELGHANQSLAMLRAELQKLGEHSDAVVTQWKLQSEKPDGMSIDRFATVTRYMQDITTRFEAQQKLITQREQKRDALVEKVVIARKKVDAVEQHRDELRGEFFKSQLSGQFKTLDDHWSLLQQRKEKHVGEY